MIEKDFVSRKIKGYRIEEFISSHLKEAGYSHTEIQRTPLGEKIIIYTSKPGLIVGHRGENIKNLTRYLKKKFKMENPQIEVAEISDPLLNPQSVASHITYLFEKYGPKHFKSTGYKTIEQIMVAGATGVEIVISGRGIPSSRAKRWRFSAGYLKKSGDISENFVKRGFSVAQLRSGSIGVKVSILTPDVKLPDKIVLSEVKEDSETKVEHKKEPEPEAKKEVKEEKKIKHRKPKTENGTNKKKRTSTDEGN